MLNNADSTTSGGKAVPPVTGTQPRGDSFPIVGIGASAGGLEALEQFLGQAPHRSGLAFVIVQHQDPTHQGLMPELLQRVTSMPVVLVRDRMAVRPNTVYVIPSNKDMSLLRGVLHLLEPASPRGLRLPIDLFFNSLADDLRELSIGVILSGMGSDGVRGVRAIKERSGVVAVQEPTSAKFDSMPRSAIDTGLADIVAPADELPGRIIAHLSRRPVSPRPQELTPHVLGALEKIVILLRSSCGHDFSLYKKSTLYRRTKRRMELHQVDRIADYLRFLKDSPQEAALLFKELLIGVTGFFRDPREWERLLEEGLPWLLAERPSGGVIRGWSAGCSTGEEAYSLTILFMEALERLRPPNRYTLQLFATDLDQDAITVARQGEYPATIATDVSPLRLERFFTPAEHGYRISREIREMVTFATQNLIMDPPFTRLDLLLCRNLLIYLETEVQLKLLPLFHYSLNPDSILFLGNAETVRNFTDLFTPFHPTSRLFRRRDSLLGGEPPAFPVIFAPAPPEGAPEASMPRAAVNLQSAADQLLLRGYTPPAVLVNDQGDILYINGRTGNFLEPAAGKANWNIFAMAREGFRFELSVAFRKVVQERGRLTITGCSAGGDGAERSVNLIIQAIDKPEPLGGMVLIVFQEWAHPAPPKKGGRIKPGPAASARIGELEQELRRYRDEVLATREGMQSSQEELKSMNEELQSANEELQSTNEELTTSKEELQSMNEELQTVNAEQHSKMDELARIGNDMNNLFNSTEIITLFLDNSLQIRRFTSGAYKLFKLIPGDVGRRLTDIVTELLYPELADDARGVLQTLFFSEKQVTTIDGRWFTVRIMPYRTMENRIDGVILTFTEITQAKRLEEELRETGAMLQAVVQAVSFIIICLSSEGAILEFNPEAERLLGRTRREVLGRNYFELFIPEPERSRAEGVMGEMLAASPPRTFTTRLAAADGALLSIQWSARQLLDAHGRVTGIVAVGQDPLRSQIRGGGREVTS